MLKISSIKILDYYKILCVFNTGEIRILDIQQSLDKANNLVQKLTNHEVFIQQRLVNSVRFIGRKSVKIKN